jgi:cardiolipin synthase
MSFPVDEGELFQWLTAIVALLLSVIASGHAVLYKRDPRAAFAWTLFAWVTPLIGPLAYFLFGINRIRRRAHQLREQSGRPHALPMPPDPPALREPAPEMFLLEKVLGPEDRHLLDIARTSRCMDSRPYVPGNALTPLEGGDEAFPRMLAAIRQARKTIGLSTYIFDRDKAGLAFLEALAEAHRRGVSVRVLIDATGARYSWPTIVRDLRRGGIPTARFLPASLLNQPFSIHLRNHRKLLLVDGCTAFTGGMNIRVGHWHSLQPRHPVQDVHFEMTGPIVGQLSVAFADDWVFARGEDLQGPDWFPALTETGNVWCRALVDGPDEDFEKLRWCLLAALAAARRRVRIVTPYFLPDPIMVSAINLAALRGVEVEILLPENSNLKFVHWASRAQWWQVLERGCQMHLTPPPFDHAKLMVVDDAWSLVGSANWDPRSLRLNFELNVEGFGREFAREVNHRIDARRKVSRPVTLQEVDARPLAQRLMDGTARLMSPYL